MPNTAERIVGIAHSPVDVPRVVVRVSEPWLEIGVKSVLEQHGFFITDEYEEQDVVVVTDDPRRTGANVALLIDDNAAASRNALSALVSRRAGAVISKTEPDHLSVAVEALCHGLVAAPMDVIETAQAAPPLEDRRERVLRLVAAGLSNPQMAERLGVSEATIKRDVSSLLKMFQVTTRVELAMRGSESGYVPD